MIRRFRLSSNLHHAIGARPNVVCPHARPLADTRGAKKMFWGYDKQYTICPSPKYTESKKSPSSRENLLRTPTVALVYQVPV